MTADNKLFKYSFISKILETEELDFSAENLGLDPDAEIFLRFKKADLSKVNSLKFGKNVKHVDFTYATLPKCDIDFSDVQEVLLPYTTSLEKHNLRFRYGMTLFDYSGHKIDSPDVNLEYVQKLILKQVDFSDVKNLYLGGHMQLDLKFADLSKLDTLYIPHNAKKIDLSYAILPKCELDLSEVEDLNLTEADLSQVINLKLPRNAKKLELRHTKLPVFDMDLSGVERLKMARENLSHINNLILPANAKRICIKYVKMPVCDLNLYNVQDVKISYSDLSQVKSLIMPKNINALNISDSRLPLFMINQNKHHR